MTERYHTGSYGPSDRYHTSPRIVPADDVADILRAATEVLEEHRALCDAEVTLDGQPARIMGIRNRFATVAILPDGRAEEFAWPTVARIVANGGAFQS